MWTLVTLLGYFCAISLTSGQHIEFLPTRSNNQTIPAEAYDDGVYCPSSRRIYLIPNLNMWGASEWHYIDAVTRQVVTYSVNFSIPITNTNQEVYGSAVLHPTLNRVYLVPYWS